jgi:internalin A
MISPADALTLQAGGALNHDTNVYIVRPTDDELLWSLERGEYCNVLCSRQMGKTSLLKRTRARLTEKGYATAEIDVAGYLGTPHDATEWYQGLLQGISRQLGLSVDVRVWWQACDVVTANQRLLQFFHDVVAVETPTSVIIFLDEIDSTLKLPYTDDFFVAIRTMYNDRVSTPAYRKLAFCLVGVATPNELIKDRRTTPYNIGKALELQDFDLKRDDLSRLCRAVSDSEETGQAVVEHVLRWTGGHPFLTLRLCEAYKARGGVAPDDVNRIARELFMARDTLRSDVHFEQSLRFLSERVDDQLATLTLYRSILAGKKIPDQPAPAYIQLKLMGIVKRNQRGLLVVRNQIYRRVFTDAWAKRAMSDALERSSHISARIEEARRHRVTRLDLSGQALTQLPEELEQLTQLQHLDLSYNQLTSIPETLGQLTQLQHLDLSYNQLTSIPETLGQLTQLQHLNLSGNQLTTMPEAFRHLTSLQELYLHENIVLSLPMVVLGPTRHNVMMGNAQPAKPGEILAYYFRVRGGRRPLNEAKLIIVGRGAVGKTSIVRRLLVDSFDPYERKTDGLQITEWPFRLHDQEDVRLHIWDFGGQEIMHATHQFFLTQRSLYLLVLNGREGGEDVEADYWLKLITSFGGDSPVIVVLNKIKEYPFDLNRRALQQKYPIIRAFIKTDCADSTGISELRKTIERETDRLEHIADAFPASWFTIKDRLAEMPRNYLTFDEYRAICSQYGETDPKAQEELAGYLHTLGIVLHYRDDPRLQGTYILNPYWILKSIYTILNADKLKQQQGEIHLHELTKILDAIEYPARMHQFLFDLMKKFGICFSFPDDEAHYLFPELLGKQEPAAATAFTPEACLHFQYHYPVLPEELLPRFIVRTHVLSEGLPRWRTGVILGFEGCRALVKADVQDKRVFIAITGPAAARRRLLAIIRSDFERLHRDIRNLQPQEMVPLPEYLDVVVPYQKLRVMEDSGVQTFPEVVGDRVIEVDVHALLNGVDLEGTRHRERTRDTQRQAVRLFYSYSHKDEPFRNELETHLKLLQRQGLLETWHDRKIEAGEEWKQKIDANLERADIVLLLVSADFIASDYCYEIEMQRALERHAQGAARVIPVLVRDVNWRIAPFAKLQALPIDGKAVTLWENKDAAWLNVSEGIERVVEELPKKRR